MLNEKFGPISNLRHAVSMFIVLALRKYEGVEERLRAVNIAEGKGMKKERESEQKRAHSLLPFLTRVYMTSPIFFRESDYTGEKELQTFGISANRDATLDDDGKKKEVGQLQSNKR